MIPNLISLSRLVLAVLFVLFVDRPAIAVAILCAAGISDWLDGWAAGKLGQRTRLGALLDPICDRLFVVPVLVAVVVTYGMPLWQLGVLIARDVANSLGSLLVWLLRPHRVGGLLPRRSGKLVTSLQFWAIVHVVLALPWFEVTLAMLAAATLWALWDYGAQCRRLLGAEKSVITP